MIINCTTISVLATDLALCVNSVSLTIVMLGSSASPIGQDIPGMASNWLFHGWKHLCSQTLDTIFCVSLIQVFNYSLCSILFSDPYSVLSVPKIFFSSHLKGPLPSSYPLQQNSSPWNPYPHLEDVLSPPLACTSALTHSS